MRFVMLIEKKEQGNSEKVRKFMNTAENCK